MSLIEDSTTTHPLMYYSPDTRMADIPWEALTSELQSTCERFLDRWWNDMDIDQTIEVSGLSDMTLAEVLALQEREDIARNQRRYQIAAFMRVEPDAPDLFSYEEAIAERDQQKLMFPQNIYRIETVEQKP